MLVRILAATIVLVAWHTASQADTPQSKGPGAEVEALISRLDLATSEVASRDWPRWRRPERIVVRVDTPARLAWLREVAPGVEIVAPHDEAGAVAAAAGADAVIGFCDPDILAAGKQVRWIQTFGAGVEDCVSIPEVLERGIHITNMQRVAGPVMAEHVFALLLGLTRGLNTWIDVQRAGEWQRDAVPWSSLVTLRDKTLLVVGLGGIGTEVARLAHAFGMTVVATRASDRPGPDYVSYVGRPAELNTLAGRADVVVNTAPLTPETRNMFDARFFAALKPGAYFINVGRGASVDTQALLGALDSGRLAGAGLDVTEPEPLPKGHPLWSQHNVIITPHVATGTDAGIEDRWLVARENLRRYVRGEPLLSVVDVEKGY